jgi:hypothetical protein
VVSLHLGTIQVPASGRNKNWYRQGDADATAEVLVWKEDPLALLEANGECMDIICVETQQDTAIGKDNARHCCNDAFEL